MILPQELKDRRQFVVWGVDKDNIKKPFVYVNGRFVDSNWQQPENWITFDDAMALVESGQAQGIGFCFNGGGLYGIDLDNVFINGELIPEAQDIVNRLDSFTEYSMSRNGLHIFVLAPSVDLLTVVGKGKAKFAFPKYPKNERRHFEIYQSSGYFALTGKPYEGGGSMLDRSQQLQALFEQYSKPATATNSTKQGKAKKRKGKTDKQYFEIGMERDSVLLDLWNGNNPSGDESADDQSFFNKLAYWCNHNVELMRESTFRSPFYALKDAAHKKKWERKDYLTRTIKNAIAGTPTTARDKDDAYNAYNADSDKSIIADDGEGGKAPTQAAILLSLVEGSGAEFFHSDTSDLYAALPINGHTEVWALDGRDFSTWLHGLYYKGTGRPAGSEAIKQTVSVLSAKARFDSPDPVTLHTRVAGDKDSIWYDLTNPEWQVVRVTAQGWELISNAPLLFRRYRHQTAQVIPARGGDIRKVLNYVNLKGQETLFLCWLVSCFVPAIPHAMPVFYGEKGAAKTTTSASTKAMIDPSTLDTLTLQKKPEMLVINLQQHWYLPFDNVSYINKEISDTLCRAITGSGVQQRKLYTNDDDTIFTFRRCLAINGISNVATRPDLLDRSILIELERISESDRRELAEVQAAFEADRAEILGGIFDTLSKAMAIFPTVKLDKLPRMADFARWGYAIGEALGGKGQEFLTQYAENRQIQNDEAVANDPVATLIVELMRERDSWENSITALFKELQAIASNPKNDVVVDFAKFPKAPPQLSKRLNAIKSNLEGVGIIFDLSKSGKRKNHNKAYPTVTEFYRPYCPYRPKP